MKWIKEGVKWVWKMVKQPFKKYKPNPHLQRNIYWYLLIIKSHYKYELTMSSRAFAFDSHVARLNFEIGDNDWDRDWPEPHLLSKLVRSFAYPIRKCWLVSKNILSNIGQFITKYICKSFHGGDGDIESMGLDGDEGFDVGARYHMIPHNTLGGESLVPPEKTLLVEIEKCAFRTSLCKIFCDVGRVEEIMRDVEFWENGR